MLRLSVALALAATNACLLGALAAPALGAQTGWLAAWGPRLLAAGAAVGLLFPPLWLAARWARRQRSRENRLAPLAAISGAALLWNAGLLGALLLVRRPAAYSPDFLWLPRAVLAPAASRPPSQAASPPSASRGRGAKHEEVARSALLLALRGAYARPFPVLEYLDDEYVQSLADLEAGLTGQSYYWKLVLELEKEEQNVELRRQLGKTGPRPPRREESRRMLAAFKARWSALAGKPGKAPPPELGREFLKDALSAYREISRPQAEALGAELREESRRDCDGFAQAALEWAEVKSAEDQRLVFEFSGAKGTDAIVALDGDRWRVSSLRPPSVRDIWARRADASP